MFKHDFPFDPTHGYTLQQLLAITPPEPAEGFESFWRETHARTLATPVNLSLAPSRFSNARVDVFEVAYDSFDGFRVGGWLAVPRDGKVERGVVMSHGYGGRSEPALNASGPAAAVLSVCGRGFDRSARPGLPGVASGHVVHGLDSKDTYLHRGCVADLWAAVSALLVWRPSLAGRIDFSGGSFGGGMGALALPWEDRFRCGFLEVPSFGHYPLRTPLPCVGSGQFVTQAVAVKPKLLDDVLAYYDAAVAARFIRQPVFVAAALFDPAVHPPGQFAVYNAITSPKTLFVKQAGHYDWQGLGEENMKLGRQLHEWFTSAG